MKILYSVLCLSFFLLFFFNAQAQVDSIYVDQEVMVNIIKGKKYYGTVVEENEEFIILKTNDGEFKFLLDQIWYITENNNTSSFYVDQGLVVKVIKGEKYYGTVIEENEEFIILKTNDGEFKFLLNQIKYAEGNDYQERFYYPNSFHTRYFIAASAIPVEKGRVYYDNFGFVINAVNYGISKNFSIGGGFEITSLIFNQEPSWFLTSKIGIPISGKNHIAVGLAISREHYEGVILSGYLVITHGSSESNVSLGITNNNYDLSNGSRFLRGPILSLSGNQRVSRHISLVTENHFHLDYFDFEKDIHHIYYTGIHGIQLIYHKGTFRFAAVINYLNEYPLFPFIGYTVAF